MPVYVHAHSTVLLVPVAEGQAGVQALYGVFWATHYRPRVVVVMALVQSVVFMFLFAQFYRWHAHPPSAKPGMPHLSCWHEPTAVFTLLCGARCPGCTGAAAALKTCFLHRKAYGRKPRNGRVPAGATAQISTIDRAASKVADDISGRPALVLNGASKPTERTPRSHEHTNGYH